MQNQPSANREFVLLNKWVNCFNELDIDGLVKLYNDRSTLIPTFGSALIDNPKSLNDYFTALTAREDLRVVTDADPTTIVSDSQTNSSSICGSYIFYFSTNGKMEAHPAFFTFFFDFSEERPIIHHHSSLKFK